MANILENVHPGIRPFRLNSIIFLIQVEMQEQPL